MDACIYYDTMMDVSMDAIIYCDTRCVYCYIYIYIYIERERDICDTGYGNVMLLDTL